MNPCPRCGMLDQVRAIRAIMQNEVRRTTFVGQIRLHGHRGPLRGSMKQQIVQGNPLTDALGAVIFLEPRYADPTRDNRSVWLTLTAFAIPFAVAALGAGLLAHGFFGFILYVLIAPLMIGLITVPIIQFTTRRLDAAATAADSEKMRGRERGARRFALWESLSYCGRDHLVYDPRNGVSFPPESTTGYLFHSIPEAEFAVNVGEVRRY